MIVRSAFTLVIRVRSSAKRLNVSAGSLSRWDTGWIATTVMALEKLNMVAVTKNNKTNPTVDEEQHRKQTMRNKQSCSMRYRREVKVSLARDPWEEKEEE